MTKLVEEGRIWLGRDGNGVPRTKTYLEAKERGLVPESIWFAEDVGTNETAKNLLKEQFDGKAVFETPKPVDLIKRVIEVASNADSIVLDFYAGSGVTAHAVLAQNAVDRGTRRFVLVQLTEPCDENSEAFKAGFKDVTDIAKERIRKCGEALRISGSEESLDQGTLEFKVPVVLDKGFRVLKIDTSNMRDVYYAPDAVAQGDLLAQVDNIKPDRTPEDLLFQVLVDWGIDLALPIAAETIAGNKVFFVDTNALAACFDAGLTDDMVKDIAKRKPLRVVFRDASYGTDSVKINVGQIFKLLSPDTEVRSI
jgi:adenine-specific DNA-methyltransferase